MRLVRRVLAALDDVLSPFLQWPSADEWEAELTTLKALGAQPWMQQARVACALDGTEIRQQRPSKGSLERHNYSVKHKQHAINFLLAVKLDGTFVFVSRAHLKPHDQQHFNATQLRDKFIQSNVGVFADGGFTLNRAEDYGQPVQGATPFAKPRRVQGNAARAGVLWCTVFVHFWFSR